MISYSLAHSISNVDRLVSLHSDQNDLMSDHGDNPSKPKHNKPHLIGETFSHGRVI